MNRFYSIFVDSDDDSSQSWLRKNQQRKYIKDVVSNRFPYFTTGLILIKLQAFSLTDLGSV
ncbi:MAG: hypothetical protein ABIJ03_02135 [Patescibacteria group bacterium]